MATALDLLMSAKEDVNLLSEQSDICTIDAKTRVIFVPSTIVVGGVQSDKNAERIKFSCPKIVGDNLDLSKFSVRINFENVSSVDFNVSIKDQYICDDVAVDGENVTFSWLIGRNAARYMGTVRFIVCAVKTDSDSNISVEWNTAIAEVPVLEGIEIDQPQIGQEEKDVINQLLELTSALVKQPNLRKRGNMRGLVRQKQKVYWSRITEKTKRLDRIKVYEKPVLYSFSVSSTAGTPEEIAAGIVPDYDRYITSFNRNFHPQEADIFWIDRIPQISEDGSLILNKDGEPTVLPDYTLKKILDTQKGNIARYGISKRGNEDG